MKPYSLEHWIVAALIFAALVAAHWLAYRIGARRIRNRRRTPPPAPTIVPHRRPGGFDGPIPVTFRRGHRR